MQVTSFRRACTCCWVQQKDIKFWACGCHQKPRRLYSFSCSYSFHSAEFFCDKMNLSNFQANWSIRKSLSNLWCLLRVYFNLNKRSKLEKQGTLKKNANSLDTSAMANSMQQFHVCVHIGLTKRDSAILPLLFCSRWLASHRRIILSCAVVVQQTKARILHFVAITQLLSAASAKHLYQRFYNLLALIPYPLKVNANSST